MKKNKLLIIVIIAAIVVAVFILLKKNKANKTEIILNDVQKGDACPAPLQLLAQTNSETPVELLPGQTGFPLKKGDRGINVARLQVAIGSNVDGIFGEETERKVISLINKEYVDSENFKYLSEIRQWQPFLNFIRSGNDYRLSEEFYQNKSNKSNKA